MNMITTNNLTMSSREIAELTGKRHDNVKRTIATLVEAGVISQPQIEDGIKSANGVVVQEYKVGKRDSFVVVAQLSPEFTARLVDRWQELEQQVANTTPQLPDFTNPVAAARAWADEVEQKQKLELAYAEAKPKIDHYDRVADLDRTMNITMAATKLGKSARSVNQVLDTLNVYNNSTKRARVFKQWFVDAGYGVVRQTSNGYLQALLTTKGEIWLGQQLSDLGLIPKNVKPLEIAHV